MADEVNQNVHVESGGIGIWIFLILAIVLVFMSVMFRGQAPLPPANPPPAPSLPDGVELVRDRDGRVVGVKPMRRV
jgi:hypothetical protein